MQISTIKNPNFEKPIWNPSNRTQVNILKKKFFWISLQENLVPRMLSHRENVWTSKCWRKSKEKKRIFFENLPREYKDLILVKKKKKLSHACVPLSYRLWSLYEKSKLDLSIGIIGHQLPIWVNRSRLVGLKFSIDNVALSIREI